MNCFKTEKCTICGSEKYSYLKDDEKVISTKESINKENNKVIFCTECWNPIKSV